MTTNLTCQWGAGSLKFKAVKSKPYYGGFWRWLTRRPLYWTSVIEFDNVGENPSVESRLKAAEDALKAADLWRHNRPVITPEMAKNMDCPFPQEEDFG